MKPSHLTQSIKPYMFMSKILVGAAFVTARSNVLKAAQYAKITASDAYLHVRHPVTMHLVRKNLKRHTPRLGSDLYSIDNELR